MQKKKFFLLLAFIWLLNGITVYGQVDPCNLPAPNNIQFNQPNSTTLNVTWNPVPGAVSYLASLENLSNPAQTMQGANPVFPAATFTVIPGNLYLFRVNAQGIDANGRICTSPLGSQSSHKADYIVIDLVVQRDRCTPSGSPIVIDAGTHYDNLTPGATYYCIIDYSPITSHPKFMFVYTNSKFLFKGLGVVPQGESLQGFPVGITNPGPVPGSTLYENPPLEASDVRISYPNQIEFHASFSSATTIFFEGPPGATLSMYPYCMGNSPGSGEGGDAAMVSTVDPVAQAALRNILPVNPFSSNLTLYFQEHPEQPVTAQLFDVNGRMHVQQTIEPARVSEDRYILNTADLVPGMYFLRLETAPGVFSTHKVVKYEE